MMRQVTIVTALTGLWFVAVGAAQTPKAEPVSIRSVKYDELGDAIRRLKGQVVVVDSHHGGAMFLEGVDQPLQRHALPALFARHLVVDREKRG